MSHVDNSTEWFSFHLPHDTVTQTIQWKNSFVFSSKKIQISLKNIDLLKGLVHFQIKISW